MKNNFKAVMLLVVLMITTLMYGNNTSVKAAEKETESVGYVFIGDSRTVGMDYAVDFDKQENTFMVAKVGKGYYWFINDGAQQLKQIRQNNNFDKWVYIFNLGVNDLSNVDKYVSLVNELAQEATVYYVSVNPTIDSKTTVKCSSIEAFNQKITAGYDKYIDSYHFLKTNGFDSRDGLHYGSGTYEKLYKFIKDSID